METLIIQVDCRPYAREGLPQLGITVEAPFSQQRSLQQGGKKQQASSKESYQNHDYQNLDNCNFTLTNSEGGTAKLTSNIRNGKNGHSSLRNNNNNNKQHIANVFNRSPPIHEGLQITQIQPGSVIDRNGQFKVGDIIVECNGVNLQRPFTEAQKTLKQFVVGHTSHGPLVMKVLRRAASSSSIPSTTGSQITVIEKDINYSRDSLHKSPSISKTKPNSVQQQVTSSTSHCKTSQKSPSSSASRYLVDALNTRKIGVKHSIKLKKGPEGGFGIKIVERDNMHGTKNRPIYVKAITTSGSAYRDGRLQEGDMLLEVNGYDLQGKSQSEVTKMLKAVGPDQEVEFVVSRQEVAVSNDDGRESQDCVENNIVNDCDKSLIDLDVPEHDDSVFESSNQQFEKKIDSLLNIPIRDGPGVYVYDIPLNDTKSAGLGLYLKYPRRADELKDLGIWIEKVITGGAAWKDGRLQPDDQILAINGINLISLSNGEASETLTAAVCRGIGPEATPNIIRLQIHRRDSLVVAKILQGTNNRIECSDIITNSHERPLSIFDKNVDNSCDSYQTALEGNTQNKTSDRIDISEASSNQNSQNDSAMSPQTQASNSIKLTHSNSYIGGRSEHNSSDKTNDTTSSAISQMTNSTTSNVPITDTEESSKEFHEQHCDNHLATKPKSIHTDTITDFQPTDYNSSSLSLDSMDTGREPFQRSGYARRTISERHCNAQSSAKDNEHYRRLKEEREQQRLLEEQLAKQGLDDDRRRDYHPNSIPKMPTSYTTNEFKLVYGLQTEIDRSISDEHHIVDTYHREVPVDVHPIEPKIEIEPINVHHHQGSQRIYGDDDGARFDNGRAIATEANLMRSMTICCPRCGLNCPCLCETRNTNQMQNQLYGQRQDYLFKRSNSLESIQQQQQQQQHHARDGLVVPRAGTVRVARNRKVNESFRAAVDRSYEGSTNESSSRQDHSELSDHRHISIGTKMSGSIANSTTSTSNEERYLISGNNSNVAAPTHKKSSSLLSKFLKFGSIKRKKKPKSSEEPPARPAETKTSASKSSRDSERSHGSKNSHARTHSSQSHAMLKSHHCEKPSMKSDSMMNGHYSSSGLKSSVLSANNIAGNPQQVGVDLRYQQQQQQQQQQQRASMHMCEQQYQPLHDNNTHYSHAPVHANGAPMTMLSKHGPNMTMVTRPQMSNNATGHYQQYSHHPAQSVTQVQHQQHIPATGGPILMNELGQDHSLYSSMRNHQVMLNPQMSSSNRISNSDYNQQQALQQWHSSHFQAPNGLWVANSSLPDSHAAQATSIYGTLPHHAATGHAQSAPMTMRPMIHQHQGPAQHQAGTTHPNGCAFNAITNGGGGGAAANSMMHHPIYHANQLSHHQPPNQQQVPFNATAVQPAQIHNHQHHQHHQHHHLQQQQQPQQIYYYDF